MQGRKQGKKVLVKRGKNRKIREGIGRKTTNIEEKTGENREEIRKSIVNANNRRENSQWLASLSLTPPLFIFLALNHLVEYCLLQAAMVISWNFYQAISTMKWDIALNVLWFKLVELLHKTCYFREAHGAVGLANINRHHQPACLTQWRRLLRGSKGTKTAWRWKLFLQSEVHSQQMSVWICFVPIVISDLVRRILVRVGCMVLSFSPSVAVKKWVWHAHLKLAWQDKRDLFKLRLALEQECSLATRCFHLAEPEQFLWRSSQSVWWLVCILGLILSHYPQSKAQSVIRIGSAIRTFKHWWSKVR